MEKQAAWIELKVDVPEGGSEMCQGSVRDGRALIKMEEREQGELDKEVRLLSVRYLLQRNLNLCMSSVCLQTSAAKAAIKFGKLVCGQILQGLF